MDNPTVTRLATTVREVAKTVTDARQATATLAHAAAQTAAVSAGKPPGKNG